VWDFFSGIKATRDKTLHMSMMRDTDHQPYFVCGPTASGKSALAMETAARLDGEIVNADAFQLYRGLEIVSAAPPVSERGTVPHHLYGVLDPTAAADAGAYHRLAMPVIAESRAVARPRSLLADRASI